MVIKPREVHIVKEIGELWGCTGLQEWRIRQEAVLLKYNSSAKVTGNLIAFDDTQVFISPPGFSDAAAPDSPPPHFLDHLLRNPSLKQGQLSGDLKEITGVLGKKISRTPSDTPHTLICPLARLD